MRRRIATAALLVAAASLLGGCVAIESVVSEQQDVVGELRVTVVVCDTQSPAAHPGCPYASNASWTAFGDGQLLLGLRVPAGVTAPATISGALNDAASTVLELHRSVSYEAELERLQPAGDGRRWIGYLSAPYSNTYPGEGSGTPAREISVVADLAPPRAADGGPFAGPMPVRPVVGARVVDPASAPADRPVACGESAFAATDGTICVDSPLEAQIGADYAFATRDFGIVAGGATASPGQSVALPFDVRGAGALPAGLTAALGAATTLPGATVAPSRTTAALANGSNERVTVPVTIPEGTPAGDYQVTLTGTLDNGRARSVAARVTVRASQAPAGTVDPGGGPAIAGLRVVPRRFSLGRRAKGKRRAAKRRRTGSRRGARRSRRRRPAAPRVTFRASEAVTVALAVDRCARAKRRRSGRGRGRRGARARGSARRCRWRRVGRFDREARGGANSLRLPRRIGKRRLKPGAHRLTAVPADGDGVVGAPARTRFVATR